MVSSGEGKPIVFLHGFTGSTDTWATFRYSLEPRCRVIAVDLPGHGGSTAPEDPARYSLERFAHDLSKVLDELGIERCAIFGYSMGGRAALRFAIAHPQRVSALILESTSSGIHDEHSRKERIDADETLARLIERDGIDAFVARWESLPMWNTQSALADSGRAALREQRLANNPRGLANSLRGAGAGADLSVIDQGGKIIAPTLILAGELDPPYIEHGRRLSAAIPNATLRVIPHSGHAVHLEQPELILREITRFIGVD